MKNNDKKRISMSIKYCISITICLIIILVASCSNSLTINKIKIGMKITKEIAKSPTGVSLLTSHSNFAPTYEITIDGIMYTIAINEQKKIIYIDTIDPNFKTEEGFCMKTTFKEIFATTNQIKKEPGWAFYIPLKSGWNAAFKISRSESESKPQDNDTAICFFKRQKFKLDKEKEF